MAWVKIDDQAPRNKKLLTAGPAAAWMWVCGIAHCQAHLSEGFIAEIAIPMIGVAGAGRSRKLAEVLVGVGLFERVDGGYLVHDYLDFNETREEAVARKTTLAAKRAASGRAGGLKSGEARREANEAKTKQVIEAKRSPDPTRPDPTHPDQRADARSKRPMFTGQRLTVFEWMLDDCTRTLGAFTEEFDLHAWFFDLDDRAVSAGLVIPKKDGGAWLQAQLVAEAQRRGLPLRMATVAPVAGKQTSRLMNAVANIKAEAS